MGHAFNHTLMDILARWHRMRGFDVLWQPGLDHAGIATQMVVERELAKAGNAGRRDMGREAFVAKVWEWKAQSGGTILEQSRRLGDSFDLSRNAFTMSGAPGAPAGEEGNFHDAVLKTFVEFYERGLIFRGKRLVNWDPHFETAISDLEVEQVETKGHLWRLRYPLEKGATYEHPVAFDEDGKPTETETRDYLVVATTRPETMLGDTGVAVHPDDPRYAHLIGKTVRLPLVGRSIPIVADAYADPEKGTGAVKITPAHDFNDWEVGKRCGLRGDQRHGYAGRGSTSRPIRPSARASTRRTTCQGLDRLDRYEARDVIVTIAEEQGWLDGIDEEIHTVPHGDRSKVAIEPFLTDQWYVDAKRLAIPALAAVRDGRTRILPEQHEKTYFHWLENIEPWCISRQLWWGHQIPVWYGDYLDEKGEALHSAEGRAARGRGACPPGARPLAARVLRRLRGRGPRGGGELVPLARRQAGHRPLRGRARGRGRRVRRGGAARSSSRCAAMRTCSTPGSRRASGRSARSAGRRRPTSSRATIRRACSSPASTSSSSGSPG